MYKTASESKDSLSNRPTMNEQMRGFSEIMQSSRVGPPQDPSSEFTVSVQFPVSFHRFFESISKEKNNYLMVLVL